MQLETKFSIGDTVFDKVTGYAGTITSINVGLEGRVSYLVEDIDTTNRPVAEWVSEGRVELWEDDEDEDDNECDGNCNKCKLNEFDQQLEEIHEKHMKDLEESNKNKDFREVKDNDKNDFNKAMFEHSIRHMSPNEFASIMKILFEM